MGELKKVWGLVYRREDGVEVPYDEGDVWVMRRNEFGRWMLCRYTGGVVHEQYAPIEAHGLGLALAAISCGYQPPHFLRRLDTLTEQTLPDDESERVA